MFNVHLIHRKRQGRIQRKRFASGTALFR